MPETTWNQIPILRDLPEAERTRWLAAAQRRPFQAGDVLCYEGDPAENVCALASGQLAATQAGASRGSLVPGDLLDPIAVLGGLPHGVKLTALQAGDLLCWPAATWWADAPLAAAARGWLARELQTTRARLDALETPVHYTGPGARIAPGPFMFEDVTLIFAFCEGDLSAVRATLPPDLSIFRRPWRGRDSVLLALADFPTAYPVDDSSARFGYTETTVFVPARHRYRVGLYVPYIYPSTWEPILLGREIYGFPKQLGHTTLSPRAAALHVDGAPHVELTWEGLVASDEIRLVRALMDWLGLEGRSLSLAFQAGDTLRRAMQLPPYRRVGVYNHKRVLAADSARDAPTWAVDQLTHAIFGVLRWYQVARMQAPQLAVLGGPLAGANLTLREAFRTQLDMRLSTARVLRDYTFA